MNVFVNNLLLSEKRGKSGFFRKKRLKRGILKEKRKRRKKRRSGMPVCKEFCRQLTNKILKGFTKSLCIQSHEY